MNGCEYINKSLNDCFEKLNTLRKFHACLASKIHFKTSLLLKRVDNVFLKELVRCSSDSTSYCKRENQASENLIHFYIMLISLRQ